MGSGVGSFAGVEVEDGSVDATVGVVVGAGSLTVGTCTCGEGGVLVGPGAGALELLQPKATNEGAKRPKAMVLMR